MHCHFLNEITKYYYFLFFLCSARRMIALHFTLKNKIVKLGHIVQTSYNMMELTMMSFNGPP